jgi:hypothetical protein
MSGARRWIAAEEILLSSAPDVVTYPDLSMNRTAPGHFAAE